MAGLGVRSNGNRDCALITGASRGIGRAIAEGLGLLEYEVVLVARSEPLLEDVHAGLKQRSAQSHVLPADITRPDDAERIAGFVTEKFRRLDVLVHAAGLYASGPVSDDVAPEIMDLNYVAPVRLTRRLLPLLKASRGQIVFINSTQALRATGNVGAYAASKSALKAFADSLREEVNPMGIRVLSVYAGATASQMQADIHQSEGRTYVPERLMQPGDIAEIVTAALRLPRSAEVIDMTIRPMQPPTPFH